MPPFAGGHCLQEKPVDHFPPLQGDPRSIVGPEEDEVGAAGWGSAPSPPLLCYCRPVSSVSQRLSSWAVTLAVP